MTHNDPNKAVDKVLVEQGSELLEGLQHCGEPERRNLAEWLLQSKQHVRTLLFMTALEEELKLVDPQRRIPIPQVRVDRAPAVTALNASSSVKATYSSRRPPIWATAAVLVAIAAGLSTLAIYRANGWQAYRTAVGEQRAVQLTDGSIVQLNTDSRAKIRLSDTAREVRLLEGEALFKVHREPSRPFTVYTSDATIIAVGTQFNVYRSDGGTKVSVLEGRVRITAGDEGPRPLLKAGEEVEVRKNGRIDRVNAPDVSNTAAWIQRRVVFKQEPLVNVIREFNRYRMSPKLRVADPALAARRYSGTFDVDDPNSLEDVLANERDIAIDRSDEAVVIRRRIEIER